MGMGLRIFSVNFVDGPLGFSLQRDSPESPASAKAAYNTGLCMCMCMCVCMCMFCVLSPIY